MSGLSSAIEAQSYTSVTDSGPSADTADVPSTPPLAEIRGRGGVEHAFYPHLKRWYPAAEGLEERVRLATYNLLLTRYGYPAQRVDVQTPVKIRDDEQPRFADIVVYDDDEHKRPLVVAEVKKPKRQDGERQAQRYASILRAVYTLWNNGTEPMSASVLVNRYPEEAVTIPDIPVFGGEPTYQIQQLEPFADDRAMTSAIRKCHNLIRNLENKKPDDAFDEFLKVLLVKFNDELRGSDYEFQVFLRGAPPEPEDENTTAQRIRALFHYAVVSSEDLQTVFSEFDDIKLKNETLVQLVKLLQRQSFSTTDVDAKSRAFETFLSGDLRQVFKEFMTPRPVVQAVVGMAEPKVTDLILDPCCGSAAFLIFALKQIRSTVAEKRLSPQQAVRQVFDFAHDRLWGTDSSKQMVTVGRLNMLVNEDGRAHILHVPDALSPLSHAPPSMASKRFDLIMTNPPFGQSISGPASLLKTFEMLRRYPHRKGGFLSEALFVERNIEWLKPNGRMFIVLPDSVLGNSTLAAVRDFIEARARLVAVISLPPDTFGPSGAKSKTSVVMLQRHSEGAAEARVDDDVFLADVRQIGYDFTGRSTRASNQLPAVVAAYRAWQASRAIDAEPDLVRVVPRSALGSVWLAPPQFVKKEVRARRRSSTWILGDICSRIDSGVTARRSDYVADGIHMVKVGNLSGRGIQWGCVERQFVTKEWLRQHPDAGLAAGDILFTSAAHGPKWIGLKVDMFTGVPQRFGTVAAFCAELMGIRVDPSREVDPFVVLMFLRSAAGYAEIQRCIRGQSGHVYRQQVEGIRVPKPSSGAAARKLNEAIRRYRASLEAQEQAQESLFVADELSRLAFPSKTVKPIIAR